MELGHIVCYVFGIVSGTFERDLTPDAASASAMELASGQRGIHE